MYLIFLGSMMAIRLCQVCRKYVPVVRMCIWVGGECETGNRLKFRVVNKHTIVPRVSLCERALHFRRRTGVALEHIASRALTRKEPKSTAQYGLRLLPSLACSPRPSSQRLPKELRDCCCCCLATFSGIRASSQPKLYIENIIISNLTNLT